MGMGSANDIVPFTGLMSSFSEMGLNPPPPLANWSVESMTDDGPSVLPATGSGLNPDDMVDGFDLATPEAFAGARSGGLPAAVLAMGNMASRWLNTGLAMMNLGFNGANGARGVWDDLAYTVVWRRQCCKGGLLRQRWTARVGGDT